MNIKIELTEIELRKLVLEHLDRMFEEISIAEHDIRIETQSTQNYKAEWEPTAFRARIEKTIA